MKIGCLAAGQLCFPLRSRLRVHGFRRQRQIRRHADEGAGLAASDEGFQHRAVAVGRFDQQLRLFFAPRARFQLSDPLAALGGIRRQVAVEGEALAVQAARHDGQ